MEKYLILLRGCPGAGKSTVAELLSEDRKYPVKSADDFFMQNGMYKFDAAKLGAAHDYCKTAINLAMAAGHEKIFLANTSTTEKEMEPYFEMAKTWRYKVVSLIVENRHGHSNIHDVPDASLEKMKKRFNIKLI